MDPSLKRRLKADKPDAELQSLLTFLNGKLQRSRGIMGKEYKRWRRNLEVYTGQMPASEADYEAAEVGEPTSFVVPLTFAQVQTMVAFCFLLYQQNGKFYMFDEVGDEDAPLRELSETLLDGELKSNKWIGKLYQSLLDAARLGMTVTKEVWTRKTVWVPGDEEVQAINGTNMYEMTGGDREVVKYEGNLVNVLSPFKFFPDPNMPLVRWDEGSWVADEEEYTISYMRELERKGLITGTKFIERMSDKCWSTRESNNSFTMLADEQRNGTHTSEDDDFVCVLAEHYVHLKPSKYGLGPEDYDVCYLVRVVNDERIVSIEKYGYIHDKFPHNVGIVSPDTCVNLSISLADTIDSIQEVVSYLVNSRVLGLRKSLARNLIIDPQMIDVASLENNSDIILAKEGAGRMGMDKFFSQLTYRDTTSGNMAEAGDLQRLLQTVTGVNDNAMGQVASGRRSATENRAANTGASARLRMTASILWESCYAPMGNKMLTNLRYGLSYEMFEKYVGKRSDLLALYDQFSPADVAELIGARDVFAFDSTTSSERGFLAQSMQELLLAIMSNPQTAALYDMDKLMEEIYTLRGVKSRRFKLPQAAVPSGAPAIGAPGAQPGMPAGGTAPPVVV